MALKVNDFRRQAAECRQLATQMRTPDAKLRMAQMAAAWDDLAQAAEAKEQPARYREPAERREQ
jgi:hypothetical protein